jgi:hypothetical protein
MERRIRSLTERSAGRRSADRAPASPCDCHPAGDSARRPVPSARHGMVMVRRAQLEGSWARGQVSKGAEWRSRRLCGLDAIKTTRRLAGRAIPCRDGTSRVRLSRARAAAAAPSMSPAGLGERVPRAASWQLEGCVGIERAAAGLSGVMRRACGLRFWGRAGQRWVGRAAERLGLQLVPGRALGAAAARAAESTRLSPGMAT